ncbi:MAG: hypothetical protein L0241_28135 [Planctomycetia bacterium]|nr:hypothetical protein [Planctomycetia bacterium]
MRSVPLFLLCVTLLAAGCGSKGDNAPGVAARDSDPQGTLPAPTPGELVEHPTYKMWAKFAPGTTITQKTTTDSENSPGQTVTTIVYSLKEKTDDHILLESQATTVYHGGRVEKNPPNTVKTPRLIPLPPGVKKEDWGKPTDKQETGEEVVTAAGKQYKAKWYKSKGSTDAGELFTTTWTSTEMPGGLVKSVSEVPAVKETTTIEVVEVKLP